MMIRAAAGALAMCALSFPAEASKKVGEVVTEIDGHHFKVYKYDDGSVIVREFGHGHLFKEELRDRMRRAVVKATGCSIRDDTIDSYNLFLLGVLSCPAADAAVAAPAVGSNATG